MPRSLRYLQAFHDRVRPWVDKYLPGVAARLRRQAVGEAGGRTSPRRLSGMEKMALASLTAENVREMDDEELLSLHRRCHQLAAATKEAGK